MHSLKLGKAWFSGFSCWSLGKRQEPGIQWAPPPPSTVPGSLVKSLGSGTENGSERFVVSSLITDSREYISN